jgi:NAD(P)H-hydrate repair Nnr-like enzyme with NAD(P)H-hydrate epimerase domain
MSNHVRDVFQKMAKQAQNTAKCGGGGGGGDGRAAAAAARSIGALVGADVLGYGAYNSIYTVQEGHRVVMFNRIEGMTERAAVGRRLKFQYPVV